VSGFLEGSAPALPKNFSAHQEMRPKVSSISGVPGYCPTEKFWHGRNNALRFFSSNEFGAQKKFRHQTLAKASGMKGFRTLS
jgi:hypothetical protein